MMLEMLSQTNWERPIYVAITVGEDNYMNLGDNFVQEGLASRITPFHTKGNDLAMFDTEKTYDRVMNKFKFGGLSEPGLYLDQTIMRMCGTHRRLFSQLAQCLIAEGKNDKAIKALAKMEKEIPEYNVPMDYLSGGLDLISAYGKVGNKKRATEIADTLWKTSSQYMRWYMQDPYYMMISARDCQRHLYVMNNIIGTMGGIDAKWASEHEEQFNRLCDAYEQLGGQ